MNTQIDINATLLDLLNVTVEAVRQADSEPADEDVRDLLAGLLQLIEHLAPERLPDPRIARARAVLMVLEEFRR